MVYMLTLGYIDGIHVTIYSSTMDPMGMYPKSPSTTSMSWVECPELPISWGQTISSAHDAMGGSQTCEEAEEFQDDA
jgi:hypothetical protein